MDNSSPMTTKQTPPAEANAAIWNDAMACNNQGIMLWQKGQHQEAVPYFSRAAELLPTNAQVLNNASLGCFLTGDYEQAERYLRQAVEIKPDYAEAFDNLGRALVQQRKLQEALPCFERAIRLRPDWGGPMFNLGTTLLNVNELTQSVFWLEKAVKASPNDLRPLINLGSALDKSGRQDEAIETYYKAIEIDPACDSAYHNILSLMEQQHQLDDLDRLITTAEKNIPGSPSLAVIKARLAKREKNYNEAISLLESAKGEKSEFTTDLLFELGLLYDRVNDSKKAYDTLEEANQTALHDPRNAHYKKETFIDTFKALREPFSKKWVDGWSETMPSDRYKTPAFIVGFPRSGTTLTGQILDSHPDLFVAEEINALDYTRVYLSTQYPHTYPGCISSLGPGDIEKMRSIFYANHRNNQQWEEAKTLVDKHPLNMIRGGLIQRIFPGAKIVFVARHPCDCIFSNYMQNFGMNDAMIHMTSIESAANFYKFTMDTWNQYRKAIPDLDVHIMRYEDLVDDFSGEVAKMLEFVGVPWDDSVLAYNKNAAAKPRTNTPSYSQITEPIYKRATARWEKYRDYFEPYLEELKPYIEDLGYEA